MAAALKTVLASGEQGLEGMTKVQLQELAVEAGIKQPGVGWPKCCPPKGTKQDIVDALLAWASEHEQDGVMHGDVRGKEPVEPHDPSQQQQQQQQSQIKHEDEEVPTQQPLDATDLNNTASLAASASDEHELIHRVVRKARSTFVADFSEQDLVFFPRTLGYGVSWLSDPIPVALIQDLVLDRNSLRSLPEEIGCLIQLRRISARHNKLQSLPDTLHKLPKLATLDVSHNALRALPQTITQCLSLRMLIVDGNLLTHLPEQLGSLRNLRELGIGSQPRLASLPTSLWRLRKTLTALWFRHVPLLVDIPSAVLHDKDRLMQHLRSNDPNAGWWLAPFAPPSAR